MTGIGIKRRVPVDASAVGLVSSLGGGDKSGFVDIGLYTWLSTLAAAGFDDVYLRNHLF
jgi:hypothetical protein